MANVASPFFRDSTYDAFLFAEIGEERNGMLLSVLSALARLDLDPWREAASLSRLQAPAANERLASLLSALPSSQISVPAPAAINRLIGLLPRGGPGETWTQAAAAVSKPKMSRTVAVCLFLVVLVALSAQFAHRLETQDPGSSPAPTLTKP